MQAEAESLERDIRCLDEPELIQGIAEDRSML